MKDKIGLPALSMARLIEDKRRLIILGEQGTRDLAECLHLREVLHLPAWKAHEIVDNLLSLNRIILRAAADEDAKKARGGR